MVQKKSYNPKITMLIILCIVLVVGIFQSCTNKELNGEKPNIVLILADDVGWTGLGCYGSKFYETPNIDKLCADGMKFTDAYADAPVCAPTRACLMSGQYTSRNGVYRVWDMTTGLEEYCKYIQPKAKGFSLDQITIAEMLKKAGYTTAHFGKWHLDPDHPSKHGFDKAIMKNNRKHFDFVTDPPYEIKEGEYLSDFMTDKALEFMEENRDKPFFLYLPDYLVHKPHEAKQELVDYFKTKEPHGFHKDPVHGAMTSSLDYTVGRIVNKIDELGLSENTIIIFYSDNGGRCVFGPDGKPIDRSFTDNLPLREGKGTMYEGGLRVPAIIKWKGKIDAGSMSNEPIQTIDIYPTLLSIAGIEPPADYILDGTNLMPVLENSSEKLNREAIYWSYLNYTVLRDSNWVNVPEVVIREGNYKLIMSLVDDKRQLFDLQADIGESENLAVKMPEKVKELELKIKKWMEYAQVPEMQENPDYYLKKN
jgi:arylsulfatase A-like enzyme